MKRISRCLCIIISIFAEIFRDIIIFAMNMNSRTSRLFLFPWLLRIVAYVFLTLCPVSVSYGYDSMGNITSIVRKVLQEGGTPIYHAYLTDHQGNVRVVVDENAAVKQVNHYYLYGALFAKSTNGGVQPFKYNGKELDRMHGLDWYDHGARHNDAAIGRWHVMDPLCEKYYDVSPYAYCHNNPIMLVDLDGKDDYFDAFGKFLFNKGNGGAIYIQQGKKNIAMQRFDLRKQSNMQMAANFFGMSFLSVERFRHLFIYIIPVVIYNPQQQVVFFRRE